jgi:hypothetical protein
MFVLSSLLCMHTATQWHDNDNHSNIIVVMVVVFECRCGIPAVGSVYTPTQATGAPS